MNSSKCFSLLALLVCALSPGLFAGDTRIWSQAGFTDFEKGLLQDLSVRSDGVLTVAPQLKELFDTSSMYLWSLARDSKGNLYAGGSGAKLYRIAPDGKGKVWTELDGLEIHAVAVDSKDRVYAATAPEGKVYRISAAGKPELFYDPKATYIWALAFDRQDNLFIATGDHGEIHRVTPDGKGKVFFKCEETHVRSLTLDAKGDVIVGTEPGGLVLRISPSGEGFVLYQMPKREVTAVAAAPDGSIYAAGVGNRRGGTPVPPSPATPPSAVPAASGQQAVPRQPAPLNVLNPAPLGVAGGTDLFQITPDGAPRRVWSSPQDVVYSIAFDSAGRPLLASGNKGNLYRIESPVLYTMLLTVPATQVTGLLAGPGGRIFAATGNVGKVYEIGPGFATQGTLESDVLDAGLFSHWGRLNFEGQLNGGRISIQTRSGNLDQPQKNWSPWSAPITDSAGARVASPASRFVQWKATLSTTAGQSPELNSVDVAYLPKNVEPHVDRIEITPFNYRFPASAAGTQVSALALPPLGRANSRVETTSEPDPAENAAARTPVTVTPPMQPAKGFLGARWTAVDPNDDSLVYKIEIRGLKETQWKLLKDKIREKYDSWDSTAFPDGEYRIRVIASDSPANPPAETLTGELISRPFTIDNTAPKISGLTAVPSGGKLTVHWHAADALTDIAKAEYSVDGGDWTVVAPSGGISDSLELDYNLTVDAAPGEHTIAVRVEDADGNQSVDKTTIR